MAGTLQTFRLDNMRDPQKGGGVAVQIATCMNAIVVDLEVLRVGISAMEDWILEVDTDLDLTVLGTATAHTTANLVDAAGESFDQTVTGAVVGDLAVGSYATDMTDYLDYSQIDTADSGTRWHQNETTSTINLADSNGQIVAYDFAVSATTGTITAGVLSASNFDAAGDLIGFNITVA